MINSHEILEHRIRVFTHFYVITMICKHPFLHVLKFRRTPLNFFKLENETAFYVNFI